MSLIVVSYLGDSNIIQVAYPVFLGSEVISMQDGDVKCFKMAVMEWVDVIITLPLQWGSVIGATLRG